MFEQINEKSLLQLAIPGSHDSGMHPGNLGNELGLDSEKQVVDIFSKMHGVPLVGKVASGVTNKVIARWAQTQSRDLANQAALGIRYFDLRICAKNAEFFVTHTLMSQHPVWEELQRLRDWLGQPGRDKEVCILDFQHFYGLDEGAHQVFSQRLHDIFMNGDRCMLAERDNIHTSMDIFSQNGWQVIVLYGDDCTIPLSGQRMEGADAILGQVTYLWPRNDSINSIWVNKSKTEELVAALDGIVQQRATGDDLNRIWVLQGVLTAQPDDIKHRPDWTLRDFGADRCNSTMAAQVPHYLDAGGDNKGGWYFSSSRYMADFTGFSSWILWKSMEWVTVHGLKKSSSLIQSEVNSILLFAAAQSCVCCLKAPWSPLRFKKGPRRTT